MKNILYLFVAFLVLLFLGDCAKMGAPQGGPKDVAPPEIIDTKPDNYSTQFNKAQLEITFDEFVRLEDASAQIVLSPPLEERLITRMRNRTLIVELNGELRENTTYTLNFGQAIRDVNEGNILGNYEFVFSTGDYLDSLGINGVLLNAFNNLPSEEQVTIMMYDRLNDSAPLLERPVYIGKTLENGSFYINNTKADTFRIFALHDQNANLIYDIPEEKIAFLDSILILSPDLFIDSLGVDSLLSDTLLADKLLPDSLRIDSSLTAMPDSVMLVNDSVTGPRISAYSVYMELFLFEEDNKPLFLDDFERPDRRKLSFYFSRSQPDSLKFIPQGFSPPDDWLLFEKHLTNDTMDYWIKDSTFYMMDSMKIVINYKITDSILNYIPFNDTLTLNMPIEKAATRKRRKKDVEELAEKEEEEQIEMLDLGIMTTGSSQDLNKELRIIPNHPVSRVDSSLVSMTKLIDTLEIAVPLSLEQHPRFMRHYIVKNEWEENTQHTIKILPGAFRDIYGLTNDTIVKSFRTQKKDYYGKIFLNITNVSGNRVVQVLDGSDKLINSFMISEDAHLEFGYLPASKYILKVIEDRNANGIWDTGNYLKKIQPEGVLFYKDEIEVRSNWEMEINWELP